MSHRKYRCQHLYRSLIQSLHNKTQNTQQQNQLKKINQACFPVAYGDSFYRDMAKKSDENLCKFAYYSGLAIGAVCTRVEPIPDDPNGRSRLYVMTLGVLAAYRNHGIGSKLVESVMEYHELW